MSYSRIDGKDEIHFVTKSDLKYMSSDADEIPKAPGNKRILGDNNV